MKLKILNPTSNEKGSIELPAVFNEQIRPDIIKRAVEALQSCARQPYGTDPEAGKKSVANVSKRRRDYKACYGHGIARTPRKILSRSGARMNWVGAFAPNTVGGRRAHPPKSAKILGQKINKQERRKAIRSAIAATMDKTLVQKHGHIAPDKYPFIISDEFETIAKTKDIIEAMMKLGLEKELERSAEKTYRAGKARLRGRKYRRRKGPLLVVSKDCPLIKAANNVPGVDVVAVNALNAELLAPGSVPGRLTLYTESAITRLGKEQLFIGQQIQKTAEEKPKTKAKTAKAAAK
jgi:large subunit ribosomal protein L4e